jgi:shikimate kinase
MKLIEPVVITGFMGCGKTEVARRLAQRLNVEMADLDELISQTEGMTPATLIRERGERGFRTIETGVLNLILNKKTAGVIALGGGAWIETLNRDAIRDAGAITVWLDTPFDICWKRIAASSEDRPLGKTREQASELFGLRLPVYALASIRIEVASDDNTDRLCSRIEAEIARIRELEVQN